MFTGLITDVGEVAARNGGRAQIMTRYPLKPADAGISICCDGVCLTATSIENAATGTLFSVDISNETLAKTTLQDWIVGRRINLERSLKVSDELGGHVVSGHVDGTVKILSVTADGESRRFVFETPEHLARYIAPKGSVALDGTSLTVNEVAGNRFGVNLIPHSLTVTTWGAKTSGMFVNLEVDVFARYVARLMEFRP